MNESNLTRITTDRTRLINILEDIKLGKIITPVFQRDFVWEVNKILELFDSIVKGFPIGSILFWKPEDEFDIKDYFGPFKIGKSERDFIYILDGYQRLTSLFSCLTDPLDFDEGSFNQDMYKKYFQISYNLESSEFVKLRSETNDAKFIPLYKVINPMKLIEHFQLISNQIQDINIVNEFIERGKQLNKVLYDYNIGFVTVKGGDIRSAVEIFSRINSQGLTISEDYMLQALSYNENSGFLFSERISSFINEISVFNFGSLKRDFIINCISSSTGRIYFDVKTKELISKYDLETLTENALIHIKKAIEFLFYEINILDDKYLPYPTQLIFISEFFRINPIPTHAHKLKLKKWFWQTTYSNYFTLYSLSLQRKAYNQFLEFARDETKDALFIQKPEIGFSTTKFPENFDLRGVRAKAIQLFFIQKLFAEKSIEIGENIIESFVFSNEGRNPANMILRLSSEFSVNHSSKPVNFFLSNLEESCFDCFFLNSELISLYTNNQIDEFIEKRTILIKSIEKQFVEELDIEYID